MGQPYHIIALVLVFILYLVCTINNGFTATDASPSIGYAAHSLPSRIYSSRTASNYRLPRHPKLAPSRVMRFAGRRSNWDSRFEKGRESNRIQSCLSAQAADSGGEETQKMIDRDNLNSTYYAGFFTSPLDQPRSQERENQMMKSTLKFVGGSAVVVSILTLGLLLADGVFTHGN
mmetsp:Transcript_25756/g.62039  ORF Transcript_25756/g.62039 Transcript_25756/m.62039 type:complete len:175 (-) Transcript_25756:304-828(-)|eukprot:CAMPEP_0114517992 /NCGR_PEP_ID=MMETSP0109-20121206/18200_1 /TAXON_ID=29199 /ORGANISM="Chlorarachnion reptans, Strain CCCM449" /LENGTH=174 /DNA_ID=CAMNT_0001698571 /DNA_START=1 /DNA_END=525 /DNA_ORIENTATION=+